MSKELLFKFENIVDKSDQRTEPGETGYVVERGGSLVFRCDASSLAAA